MAHCDKCKLGQCKRCEREDIRLVTDVLKERLSMLFLTVAPPMDVPGPADVIIYVSKRADSTEVVRLLCHSCMLKRPCDFFREILEYTRIVSRRPTIRPPSFVLDRNSFFMEPDGEGGFLGPAARTIYENVKRGSVTGLKRQSVVAQPEEEAQLERQSIVLAQRASMVASGPVLDSKACFNRGRSLQASGEQGGSTTEDGVVKATSSPNSIVAGGEAKDGVKMVGGKDGSVLPDSDSDPSPASVPAPAATRRVTIVDPKDAQQNTAVGKESQQGGVKSENLQGGGAPGGDLAGELRAKLGNIAGRGQAVSDPADHVKTDLEEEDRPPSVEGGDMADEPCSIRNDFLVQLMAFEAARRETVHERETLVKFHHKGIPVGKYYVKLKMLSWTEAMLHGLMEYIYTDRCHLTIQDLPLVYAAADKMMLTSFTQAVRYRDPVPYVRFAMENEDNRRAILKLCQLARCPELESVQQLCEAFAYERGNTSRNVHILVFHSAKRLGRHADVFTQGFHNYCGSKFCILKDLPRLYEHGYPEECFKNPQWTRSRRSLLNTYGRVVGPPGSKSERDAKDLEYIVISRQPQGFGESKKQPNMDEWCTSPAEKKNKDKVWRVYLFGQEIARACYRFFRYACGVTHRPVSPESFSLRMVSGLIVGDILVEILKKAVPEGLDVVQRRGSGYFIGGFNYGNNITLTGHPIKLLEGAKCIPKDMIGRAALRIDFPSERTFVTYMSTSRTVGVQIEATSRLFFVKALEDLMSMLEYATGMNEKAFIPWEETRTMVELVKAIEPF